jgi:hypothetical protein
MSVRTQPGQTEFTSTPCPFVAAANWRVSALRADLEIEYDGA